MTDTPIATVGDLIAALTAYDPTTPVRLATQPGYPMEHALGRVVCTPDDAEGDGTPPTDPPVVWLGAGDQVGYLPALAANALGWS
ncbi:hypothetical protein [Saccharothrix deserti]|uniref:hypothetical protein n=1 Tax=Saccharothrix deserti TaxID=2593674 RepID=UPI00131C2D11|nr:hypothetical protein [Saccharothrix deserti]